MDKGTYCSPAIAIVKIRCRWLIKEEAGSLDLTLDVFFLLELAVTALLLPIDAGEILLILIFNRLLLLPVHSK